MKLSTLAAVHAALATITIATSMNYTTVTGHFLQDDNATNATTFDYTTTNLGLINRTYPSDTSTTQTQTQWQRFTHHLTTLNANTPPHTTHKLLILGRHGEGHHNAAESFYGTPAWNCYYSLLNGNATTSWADPTLTEEGIEQALVANKFFAHALSESGMPAPQSYYTSPMQRCLATANLTFSGLDLPAKYPFIPTIKEFLREGISLHTCDRRHNRTYIASMYPDYPFEAGFAENDTYWTGVVGETPDAQDVRSRTVLDDIFSNDNSTYISITSHSGEIASLLRVLGHRVFSLRTGAVIPVLVKAETMKDEVSTSTPSFTISPHCTAPLMTSASSFGVGGCLCPSSAAPVTTPLISIGPFRR
ncbi:putative phosphoglycerate mutase pmu1 [Knufia fluminis]|uniref:Phosphoglycerate mutase pmu1 n=1 Tax=Knufia fluminis TaxID=191047 RepID=A0AAN8ELY6_9EURO|nr:putative phosphoglycerate mutase pmu1 [Knufia fluminis]